MYNAHVCIKRCKQKQMYTLYLMKWIMKSNFYHW